ncbi:MAG: hypothetical protein ACOC8E_08565 [Planctomycetota bacterium]
MAAGEVRTLSWTGTSRIIAATLACIGAACGVSVAGDKPATPAAGTAKKDNQPPFADLYRDYVPHFIELIRDRSGYYGEMKRYRVPRKKRKVSSEQGFLTLSLINESADPRGEVAWEASEEGDLYTAPYVVGDRLVSVRQMPFNITTRYRSTGKLIGRLALPPLSRNTAHPLVEGGPQALPCAQHGHLLAVTDGRYYLVIDVEKQKVRWKRLIDNNDPYEAARIRFALDDKHLAVVKNDFDQNAIYMLSSRTGKLLWRTDPRDGKSPQPIYDMRLRADRLYGLAPHPAQGFYFECLDAATGKRRFRTEGTDYDGVPSVRLMEREFGSYWVARAKDRQDFDLRVFDGRTGKHVARIRVKGAGDFGQYGRVSATGQGGAAALLGVNTLTLSTAGE